MLIDAFNEQTFLFSSWFQKTHFSINLSSFSDFKKKHIYVHKYADLCSKVRQSNLWCKCEVHVMSDAWVTVLKYNEGYVQLQGQTEGHSEAHTQGKYSEYAHCFPLSFSHCPILLWYSISNWWDHLFKDKSAACIEDMESIIISMYLECTSEIPNMQLENMQNINMLQGDSKLAILFYIIIFFSLFKFEFPLLKEIPDASLQNFVACVCVCVLLIWQYLSLLPCWLFVLCFGDRTSGRGLTKCTGH